MTIENMTHTIKLKVPTYDERTIFFVLFLPFPLHDLLSSLVWLSSGTFFAGLSTRKLVIRSNLQMISKFSSKILKFWLHIFLHISSTIPSIADMNTLLESLHF